jgi:nucleotide-binding universal stress UspA family protein
MTENRPGSRQILVALDGSSPAQAAASSAIHIASTQHLSIRGLNVVSSRLVMEPYSNYKEELKRDQRLDSRPELVQQFARQGSKALQWLEDRCREQNVPVTTEILFGGVRELLLKEANQSTLIAQGQRGYRHNGEKKRIGHNFRKVAHRAEIPILVGDEEQESLRRVLLAYNGSTQARQALTRIIRWQKSSFEQVIVVVVQQIGNVSQQRLSKVRTDLDASGLSDYVFISLRGRPAPQIVAAAEESRADLIVMGSYRYPALIEWLLGSTVESVLRKTHLPVMLV